MRVAAVIDKYAVITAFLAFAALPAVTGDLYALRLGGSMLYYAVLVLGMNVVTGFAGMLDLGYAAFFGIGAYTYALLNSYQLGLHLPFAISLPASGVAGLVTALMLGWPAQRLKGDYLAVVTLAYGQIVRQLMNNLDRPVNITNGPNGIVGIDAPLGLGLDMTGMVPRYYVMFTLALAVAFATSQLAKSKYGRSWMAMREDANAASCMGIELPKYRILAYSYGATVAALAGACFAMWQGAVFPTNFGLHELVTVLCMLALGGAGSMAGAVWGAIALVAVPELLRSYSTYRMVVFGALLVAGMRWRPQGWLPRTAGRRRFGPPNSGDESFEIPTIKGGRMVVDGLSVSFGGVKALEGVSFTIEPGEVLGVIGPNGAGKSTLVNVISGLYKPAHGTVTLDGRPIAGLPPHKAAIAGISRTFQNIRLFDDLTVEENVLVGHHLRLKAGFAATLLALPLWRKRETEARGHAREVLSFLGHGLAAQGDSPVASLAYGDKRRVELARALVSNPKILLLDEPAAGMSKSEMSELVDNIRRLNQAGYTMLVVEHHMEVISAVCHKVLVLDHGQELAFGTPAEVLSNEDVAVAYLGSKGRKKNPATPKAAVSTAAPVLELSQVRVAFGAQDVLAGVDLTVQPGSMTCLVGSNAAGKTTTCRAVVGELRLSGGCVTYLGRRIDGMQTADIVTGGIGVVPEGRRVFAKLTVAENLELGAYRRPERLSEGLDRVFALFPVLYERRHQKAGTLSGGEQQMLAIGRAIVGGPRLMLLDEPSMGLAPAMADRLAEALVDIVAQGVSMLVMEQNVSLAAAICDDLYILRGGVAIRRENGDGDVDLVNEFLI